MVKSMAAKLAKMLEIRKLAVKVRFIGYLRGIIFCSCDKSLQKNVQRAAFMLK